MSQEKLNQTPHYLYILDIISFVFMDYLEYMYIPLKLSLLFTSITMAGTVALRLVHLTLEQALRV